MRKGAFMETVTRMLPKIAYSLEKADAYMSINYGIKIDRDDLLDYLRDGVLVSSLLLKGNSRYITRIDREKIPNNRVSIDPFYCNFKIENEQSKVVEILEGRSCLVCESKNLQVALFYKDKVDDAFLGERCKVFNGSEVFSFGFSGYFTIPNHVFNTILNGEMFSFPMRLSVNSDEHDSEIFIGNSYNATFPMSKVCILHDDLMVFLASMGVIDDKYKIPEEIGKLNAKIFKLEKEKSSDKLSTKTKNTMARLIVNLIDLQYGYKNQTDIIKAFKKKGEDNMREDGEIVQDFTQKGLMPPSSKFIRGILGDLEEK